MVRRKAATKSLQQWDCLAGQVVRLDNTPLFTGALLSLPPSEAERVQRIPDKTKSRRSPKNAIGLRANWPMTSIHHDFEIICGLRRW